MRNISNKFIILFIMTSMSLWELGIGFTFWRGSGLRFCWQSACLVSLCILPAVFCQTQYNRRETPGGFESQGPQIERRWWKTLFCHEHIWPHCSMSGSFARNKSISFKKKTLNKWIMNPEYWTNNLLRHFKYLFQLNVTELILCDSMLN